MEKVFSSSDPGALLHVIMNTAASSGDRVDLSPPEEFLQISVIPLTKGRALNPHRALVRSVRHEGPVQEAWIVMRGSIEVRLFDLDNTFLKSAVLSAGWLLLTFRGGHSFETADDQTTLIECKAGPYVGRDYEFL
jgi:hypothetical protein